MVSDDGYSYCIMCHRTEGMRDREKGPYKPELFTSMSLKKLKVGFRILAKLQIIYYELYLFSWVSVNQLDYMKRAAPG